MVAFLPKVRSGPSALLGRLGASSHSQRWIGLDLGSQSIKLAQLERTADGLRLVNWLVQELPSSAGQPVDRLGWLQSALTEFDGRDVHVAYSGPGLFLRRIPMPLMSSRELAEAVKWQIKDELPFPVSEAILDVHVLGQIWEKDIKKQDVLVAAATTASLREVIEILQRAGMRVESVTPTATALWAAASKLVPEVLQGSVVLLEMGSATTHVIIAKDGQIRVVRDIPVGSASITEALVGSVASEHGEIAVDPARAEALKRQYGILTETATGTTNDGVPLFHVAALMRPILEQLLTELSRFLDFYKVQMEEGGISRILLCGGGANLKSLQHFLAEGLGMTVELFNPLTRLTDRVPVADPEQVTEHGPRLATAIGTALTHGADLNLLPNTSRRARATADWQQRLVPALAGVGGLLVAGTLGLLVTCSMLQWQLKQRQQTWNAMEPGYTHLRHLQETTQQMEGTIEDINAFLDQQPVWEGMFKELSQLVPDSIELSTLTVTTVQAVDTHAPHVHLKGKVVSESDGAQRALSTFIDAMNHSSFFTSMELTSSEMRAQPQAMTQFEIDGALQ